MHLPSTEWQQIELKACLLKRRYNNQDYAMPTKISSARNEMGENYDLWQVNTERSYYEKFTKQDLSETTQPVLAPEKS